MPARNLSYALLMMTWLLTACTSMQTPLHTAPYVDLSRYMGDWYVIANIPYFAEKDCLDSIESYAMRNDGHIDNWFSCRKKSFEAPLKKRASALATVEDKKTNATWSVRFFGFISVKYLVLDLDPDYQWAIVGHPSRRYGWILARAKSLPDSTYQSILRRLATDGYDATKFQKVPQQAPGH